MTIEETEKKIVDEFSAFEEWMDKYEYLIELGSELEIIAPELKTPERLIKGCQSRVWLGAENRNGAIHLSADSDAIITKGIISLLIRVFQDRTPEEILSAKLDFIDQIGLRQNLSPTRANGLVSMIEQIRAYALSWAK